jgi:hypothetical protein
VEIGNLVHAFFDSAGPGGAVVLLVFGSACVIYFLLTRWILGDPSPEQKKRLKRIVERQ